MASLERLKKRRDRLEKELKEVNRQIEEAKDEPSSEAVKKGDLGPDVSNYQGSVDWDKVAGQCSFAFVKATEGRTYKDPTFTKARLDAMKGLAVGAYHFARPDNNIARDEALHFVKTVESAGGDFISLEDWRAGKPGVLGVLDFEHQPFSPTWARLWLVSFKELTGQKPVAYGYGSSLTPIKDVLDEFAAVWIAGYPNYANYSGPAPFLHQFTDRGSCAGVSGPCDMNRVLV